METIRAAGYVRVSSKDQVDGESLNTQRESIKNYAKANDFIITEIYADEGISGRTTIDRPQLLKCLDDGLAGMFDILIIHRLSRLGRNARELLNNCQKLTSAGIQMHSIREKIDFSSKYGEFMLTMLEAVAQLERDIIKEQMLENRIARGKRGIPTAGKLPYGRLYNKQTGIWSLIPEAVRKIEKAAKLLIDERKHLTEISLELSIPYNILLNVLKYKCGDKFVVKFKGEEPLVYNIPRLLDEETIERVKECIGFNRRNNRTDVYGKYLLSGFLRCEKCGSLLSGQTQSEANQYYTHVPYGGYNKCRAFASVILKPLEDAVFQTIFENLINIASFEKAIAENMPDQKMIDQLYRNIKEPKKELSIVERDINKLIDSVLKGTLSDQTVKHKEQELLITKKLLKDRLENDRIKLNSLPNVEEIKSEADKIRRYLMEKYSGKERLTQMTFDEKRNLLHLLFDGKDNTGFLYGIYINKTGKGKNSKVDYFLYGKLIVGLRTLRGNNINYMGDVDLDIKQFQESDNYKTKINRSL